jgi:hypothetical protein
LEPSDLLDKLQQKVESDAVGVELWFDTEEWLRAKATGVTFADFVAEVIERWRQLLR